MPYSADARSAAAEVDRCRCRRAAASRSIARDLAPARAAPAPPAACLRQPAQHQPPQRRRQRRQARRPRRPAGCRPRRCPQRLVHRLLQHLGLVAQLGGGRQHVAVGGRVDLPQQRAARRAAAGCGRARGRGSTRPPARRARLLGSRRASRSRVTVEQRPHDAAAARLHAEQRPAARARRPAGRGSSRPGRWPCGRSRPGRARRARARARRPRSAPRAPAPRGFRGAGISHALDVQRRRRARAQLGAEALVLVGRRRAARGSRAAPAARPGPSSSSSDVQQADGVGAAGQHRQHAALRRLRAPRCSRTAAVTRSMAPLDISRI